MIHFNFQSLTELFISIHLGTLLFLLFYFYLPFCKSNLSVWAWPEDTSESLKEFHIETQAY